MAENDIEVSWGEARDANLANWDDRVGIHLTGYGLEAFEDPAHLSSVITEDLAALTPFLPNGVRGLDVCHLQCHIGTDTLSLARSGARVTALDFSPAALEAAERLATAHGQRIRWVHSDVMDAASAIGADFDLVYTSIGTICWLKDLDRWAAQVARLLRDGGTFFIRDGHPALYALDETADDLRIRYRYFPNGQAQTWDDAGTYSGEGTVEHTRTYEWPHSLAEIVNALIGAGLRILRLDEGATLPWQFSPRMEQTASGWAWPGEERENVPCTFTIIARKE
ncbi:methyltransferase [Microbacterium nanhaiense]|uniref:Methyltransferase n=1 Tax=Microbacterium nanhaiense TaxID=1301026 RepID=A0ABQ2N0F0_9MICO|nr:class I SAM-dependent methyltransferase [Microbacterium nanhaiense]GGO61969.1 methyltransferase [Microbacterium nanhaiense]